MTEPLDVMLDIIELRAYARTKAAVDNQKPDDPEPDGPLVPWVWDVQHQIANDLRARRENKPRSTSG